MICQTWCTPFIQSNIAHSKDSIQYKRSVIAKLISLLALPVLSFDCYNDYTNGYTTLGLLVAIGIAVIFVNYILFHNNKTTLRTVSTILVATISFLSIISLYIDGYGKESALFWTASLPIYVFAQHGLHRGIIWSIVNIVAIAVVTIASLFAAAPIFSFDILIQILIGYGAISFIVYYFEKIRFDYEVRLERTAKEREILLKELHHRVKNNMQVMIGLLWLQAENIKDTAYRELFHENIDRLRAMAIVHEALYTDSDFEEIDMRAYLSMFNSHLSKLTRQRLVCNCQRVSLDMKSALSVGLIVNESVTNAIKYAYDQESEEEIVITFEQDKSGRYLLRVEDHGKGLKEGKMRSDSIGMLLIQDMVKSLESAEYTLTSDNGVTVEVSFEKGNHYAA